VTDAGYTHIELLADRTGSMGTMTKNGTRAADATAGIRSLLKEQAGLPGKLTVSLREFDTLNIGGDQANLSLAGPVIRTVAEFAAADDPALAEWFCSPRGNTPLLDAVGTTIVQAGERLAAMPEDQRPGNVVVVIATDGEENDSRDWDRQRVRDLIEQQQRDYGWKFIYIGASPEAFAEARKMGMPAASTVATAGSAMHDAYVVTSGNLASFRASGQSGALHYSGGQRAKLSGEPATVWKNPFAGDDEEQQP
jgi:hypothetical protein